MVDMVEASEVVMDMVNKEKYYVNVILKRNTDINTFPQATGIIIIITTAIMVKLNASRSVPHYYNPPIQPIKETLS